MFSCKEDNRRRRRQKHKGQCLTSRLSDAADGHLYKSN